jgi:hypothetical protein
MQAQGAVKVNLVPLYRQMAADGASFRGLSILQHRAQIVKIVRSHHARTLLDYGSGAGDAWRQPHRLHRDLGLRWFDVTLYDPAFPEHDEKPLGLFDGVLCSDVLEHIPEDDVDRVVTELFAHARKFVWASVCCRPAKKSFPDGTNMHVTQRPLQWWQDTLEQHRPRDRDVQFYLVETP